ncbi:hypothetical protein U9M48_008497 [Paspalum notatum var. saurae]|uniref:Integrase catalytic domain-containing protein n=1 Tax=Paspalum notatum var. saurae TaxID=547442 RepID=A0AAQ3SQ78_PASNO
MRSGNKYKRRYGDKYKKDKYKKRRCYECGEFGHYIADFPKKKEESKERKRDKYNEDKSKSYKKKQRGYAHVGEEWDSDDESSSSDDEGVASVAIHKATPTPHLFTNLSNDEDDNTLTCLMAKGRKVQSDDSCSSDEDEHSSKQKMIKEFGVNGYNVIKNLMKKLDKRKMTLDKQEDLLILEKERNLALEKSLAEDKEKMEELTRELSLAKSTMEEKDENLAKANSSMDNLKNANVELQESLSSLNVRFKDLEVQYSMLWETTSSTPPTILDSNVSTSKGCNRCFDHDIDACKTNREEIGKLKQQVRLYEFMVTKEMHTNQDGYKKELTKCQPPISNQRRSGISFKDVVNPREIINGQACPVWHKGATLHEVMNKIHSPSPTTITSQEKVNKGNQAIDQAKSTKQDEPQDYSSSGSSWVLDSGCTNHMTGERSMFNSLQLAHDSQEIVFGDSGKGEVLGLGNIPISNDQSISNVLLVDSLGYNLLSVSQLCEMGYNCLFTDEGVQIIRRMDSSIAFTGRLKGKLYLVDFTTTKVSPETCLVAKSDMGWLWHRRLAHVGMRNLAKLLKGEHILGLTNVVFEKDRICGTCQAGKQVGVLHPSKNIVSTTRPLELLHMDLFGPAAYISIGSNKYGLVIVDDFPASLGFEVQETLNKFMRRAQNEFEVKIKKIRSDNGREFKNTGVKEFLDEEGIKHEFSAPYSPQQNGVVERKNRTLIDMARTMLDEYKISDQFWAEAVNTACHAINRLYLHKIMKKTSYELLTGNKSNCFILNKKPKSSKFAPKVDEGALLGYCSNAHAYCVFNKTTGCVEVARDVTFDETNSSQKEQVASYVLGGEEPPCKAIMKLTLGEVKPQANQVQDNGENEDEPSLSIGVDPHKPQEDQDQGRALGDDQKQSQDQDHNDGGPHIDQANDEDGPIQHQDQQPHPRVRQTIQRDHPVDNILGKPLKVEQALEDPDWVLAMQEELSNFKRNEVWSLVERPNQNVIGTKWVFRNKQDEHGVVTRNKARLVAQGFTQVEGLDFGETYAPMARLESIRILIAFATHHNFKLYQMDVKSAFLNGPIQELVYVEQPSGFQDPKFPHNVYKLHKALYGLKQAPRAWYECLKDFLLKNGFEIGKADSTLFTRKFNDDLFVCQIYVDDIIFGSTNKAFCD